MRKTEREKMIFKINARKRNDALLPARLFRFFIFSFAAFSISLTSFAQTPPPNPPKPNRNAGKTAASRNDTPVEKSIAVDGKVNVKLCVAEGKLKINGWERDEIRAFVADGNGGASVGFKILQKNKQTNAAVWVAVVEINSPKSGRAVSADECLSGGQIELDVPRGAIVSVKSRDSETVIDSVAKATVENVGGGIFLSRVRHGVEATTYEGDITVEKSGGAMSLTTTTGNIVAFDVSPGEVGDAFRAKTNGGAIVLRQIEYRQIEANSNSGAIKFTGEFLAGGQYTFNAFNGSINLQIPQNSSCRINASYGFGAFNSEIPLSNVVKSFASAKAQNLSARIGTGGEATLNLSTYSGTIQIKKGN